MIKLPVSVFCLLFSFIAWSQKDSTSLIKLTNRFAAAYSVAEKQTVKAGGSSFDALEFAVGKVLRPENPYFRNTWNDFKTAFPQLNADSLAKKITDTLFQVFYTTNEWKGDQILAFRFSSGLSSYTRKMCDCITEKVKAGGKEEKIADYQEECDNALQADVPFITSFRNQVSKVPVADRAKLLPMMQKDIYQHCPVYNSYVNSYHIMKVTGSYYTYLYGLVDDVANDIIRLYKKQRADSLIKIFPDYKKYAKDIELSAPMSAIRNYTVTEGSVYKQETGIPSVRSMVFYTAKGKTKLEGQIILNYIISSFMITITSYKYVTVDKIQNKEQVFREIEDVPLPPPPRQEFKKVTGQ